MASKARPFGPLRMSNPSRVDRSKFFRLRLRCPYLDVLGGVLHVSCLGTLAHTLSEVDSLLVEPLLVMLVQVASMATVLYLYK